MRNIHDLVLEVRHLQLVRAVADTGTLAAAADRLCVTPSALSHRLRELEERLGGAVFQRQGRRMRVTPLGRRVLQAAENVLGELARTRRDLARLAGGEVGELRISTGCYTCYHWLPRLLPDFQSLYPQVELRLLPEAMDRLDEALGQHELDLAIASRVPKVAGIQSQALFEDEMLLLVAPGHPIAGADAVPLSVLEDERLIVHGSAREAHDAFLSRRGIRPQAMTELMLSEAIVEWVGAGLGVTLMDRWAAKRYLDMGLVRGLRLAGAPLRRPWYGLTAREGRPAYVDALIELIRSRPPTLEPVS